MYDQTDYDVLVKTLSTHFGERLKLIVLFGSRSRAESRLDSDHDIFIVAEDLPHDPLARQRTVMAPLLPVLWRLPERLSLIAKTPQELQGDLTSLLVDVCADGIGLYGDVYFAGLRSKVMHAVQAAGLQRRRLAGTWMWMFPSLPTKEWSVTWEGYREHI
jgi:hypothetical protein